MLKITSEVSEFQAEDKCVVYFTAEWCNPCKQLKPHYGKVSVMDPETSYYLVDVDKIPSDVVNYYELRSIPQIFVMKKGEITDTIKSRTAEAMLEELNK